jgi:basic membrane lipoprotein Med (substrate-binding protein (PBP1-ABC) superfamily)
MPRTLVFPSFLSLFLLLLVMVSIFALPCTIVLGATLSLSPLSLCLADLCTPGSSSLAAPTLRVDWTESPTGPLDPSTGLRTSPDAEAAFASSGPALRLRFHDTAVNVTLPVTFDANPFTPRVGSWSVSLDATTCATGAAQLLVDSLRSAGGGMLSVSMSLDSGATFLPQELSLGAWDCANFNATLLRPTHGLRKYGGARVQLKLEGGGNQDQLFLAGPNAAAGLLMRLSTESDPAATLSVAASSRGMDCPVSLPYANLLECVTTSDIASLHEAVFDASNSLYLHVSLDGGQRFFFSGHVLSFSLDPTAAEPLHVGFAFGSEVLDFGWAYAANLGRLAVSNAFGASVGKIPFTQNMPRGSPTVTGATIAVAETFLKAHPELSVLVVIGSAMVPMLTLCQRFPAVHFLVSDDIAEVSTVSVGHVPFWNVSSVPPNCKFSVLWGELYPARYLSGLIAGAVALERKLDKLAFLAGFHSNPQVVAGLNAFTMGVRRLAPNVTVHSMPINGFTAPYNESMAARHMLAEGFGMLAHHTNSKVRANKHTTAQTYG